ncbi:MAG: hypothetical protein U0401_21285 [Anaerolineae bacterium]
MVSHGLWGYSLVRMDLRTTGELAERCLTWPGAANSGRPSWKVSAWWVRPPSTGAILFRLAAILSRVMPYDPRQHHAHASVYGQSQDSPLIQWLLNLWCLGYLTRP